MFYNDEVLRNLNSCLNLQTMSSVIGHKVKFINENLEGIVKSVGTNGKLLIEASDGFDYEVNQSEIIVIKEDNSHLYKIDGTQLADKIKIHKPTDQLSQGVLNRYTTSTKYQFEKVIEIDLHLEELVEFPMKLDDWQRLHTQMQHVKKCLDAAINQNIRKLVFIHGVGQGVLKTELRNYLSEHENLSFKDADYREYGSGATEVFIKH